jgi:urease accessory protein
MKRFSPLMILSLVAVFLSSNAMAHTGIGDTHGFVHGFMHPVSGVDHIMAMFAVGLLAANWGGRAIYFLPVSFLAMMTVGGILGLNGVEIPMVELGISASLVIFGLTLALNISLPLIAGMSIIGFFALFHGHAHGAEMPADISGFDYAVGFLIATGVLHAAGIAFGLLLPRLPISNALRISQTCGALILLTGGALLAGFDIPF